MVSFLIYPSSEPKERKKRNMCRQEDDLDFYIDRQSQWAASSPWRLCLDRCCWRCKEGKRVGLGYLLLFFFFLPDHYLGYCKRCCCLLGNVEEKKNHAQCDSAHLARSTFTLKYLACILFCFKLLNCYIFHEHQIHIRHSTKLLLSSRYNFPPFSG